MHDLMCLHTSNDGSVVRKGACKCPLSHIVVRLYRILSSLIVFLLVSNDHGDDV